MICNLPKVTILLVAVFAALAITACGGDDPDVVVLGPDDPVEIRTLISLTGESTLGESLRAGIELAVDHFGPVHGHRVELGPVVDSMCNPDDGRAGAERIAAAPEVLGVVGTSCSSSSVAASPVLTAAGVVMVSPAASSPVLTSDLQGNPGADYHPGFFRVANNDLNQVQAIAGFAYDELGLRRMVTMHDGDVYTTTAKRVFEAVFTERGGEVAFIGAVVKGQTDMTALLAEFAAAGPDGVFMPLFRAEAQHFIPQLSGFDGLEGVAVISGSSALVADVLALPESVGVYFAGPPPQDGGNFNVATGRTAAEALAAYESAYTEFAHVTPYWAHAYDATTLLLSAIRRAAVPDDGNVLTRLIGIDDEGTLRISRSALRMAVWEVSNDTALAYGTGSGGFPGLTGLLACDDYGDCAPGIQVISHHTDASVTDPGDLPVVYRFEP